MRDHVSELREGANDSRGGSSETDVSEFTIRPAGSPLGAAVTKATPVGNRPRASRNERVSGAASTGESHHALLGSCGVDGAQEPRAAVVRLAPYPEQKPGGQAYLEPAYEDASRTSLNGSTESGYCCSI
jgi:hypothetical protein